MSLESERFGNKSPTAQPPDTTCTDPVNCEWDTCMQHFSCITDLVQHIEETHMIKGIVKDYMCLWRNCLRNGKPFKDRYRLVDHLRIHSGEKPKKCTYQGCNKTFSRLDYLRLHVQRHNEEKPYICQIQGCNKSFSNSLDCSRHQRRHSKQKPFACTFPGCDKRYTERSSLRKHTRKHTQRKKPSKCKETSEKTPNKKHFKHHSKRHHQLSKPDLQVPSLIAAPPQQHPYHAQTGKRYLQLPSPMVGLPDINTIFDAQGHSNHVPDNSNLQSQSMSPLLSLQLSSLSSHHKRLVVPSLSSMTSSTNVQSHSQSADKHTYSKSAHLPTAQYIPSHLPPYEDIQRMHYKSPLSTQQSIMSHQQDYFAISTSSMSK